MGFFLTNDRFNLVGILSEFFVPIITNFREIPYAERCLDAAITPPPLFPFPAMTRIFSSFFLDFF